MGSGRIAAIPRNATDFPASVSEVDLLAFTKLPPDDPKFIDLDSFAILRAVQGGARTAVQIARASGFTLRRTRRILKELTRRNVLRPLGGPHR
jgi:hypothetical protein